uniref:Uncharacterized protein n=1 Tax=Pithovirus LCDPAC02 TaxID=2506601 RepID=A0A481YP85_9VIRU|nr:MAG: hypothetical protein LCDPAC02_02670 [Pithovirus LCDPAC02]
MSDSEFEDSDYEEINLDYLVEMIDTTFDDFENEMTEKINNSKDDLAKKIDEHTTYLSEIVNEYGESIDTIEKDLYQNTESNYQKTENGLVNITKCVNKLLKRVENLENEIEILKIKNEKEEVDQPIDISKNIDNVKDQQQILKKKSKTKSKNKKKGRLTKKLTQINEDDESNTDDNILYIKKKKKLRLFGKKKKKITDSKE